MFRVNLQEVFDRVEVNSSDCDDCGFLTLINEEEGIECECSGSRFDCPQVAFKAEELNQFMSDHPEEFELIEEVK